MLNYVMYSQVCEIWNGEITFESETYKVRINIVNTTIKTSINQNITLQVKYRSSVYNNAYKFNVNKTSRLQNNNNNKGEIGK